MLNLKLFKGYIVLYFLIALIVISLINILSEPQETIKTVRNLGLNDVFYIFINNLLYTTFSYLISFTGLSIILVFKIFILIGKGPSIVGVENSLYYFSSMIHGLGELIVGCIIFCFTIQHIKVLYSFFLGKTSSIRILDFYKNFLKYILPITILIIFVSSLAEVYIANKIISFFL